MILENTIAQVIEHQKQRFSSRNCGLKRELVPDMRSLSSHALIISGIRRCGKSTLLMQMMKAMDEKATLYLNFESPHLYGFVLSDFARLDNIIAQKGVNILFFDELQLVEGFEMYVRQKLDEGFKVIITGSNAAMFNKLKIFASDQMYYIIRVAGNKIIYTFYIKTFLQHPVT